jgi:hypothetical protein
MAHWPKPFTGADAGSRAAQLKRSLENLEANAMGTITENDLSALLLENTTLRSVQKDTHLMTQHGRTQGSPLRFRGNPDCIGEIQADL